MKTNKVYLLISTNRWKDSKDVLAIFDSLATAKAALKGLAKKLEYFEKVSSTHYLRDNSEVLYIEIRDISR